MVAHEETEESKDGEEQIRVPDDPAYEPMLACPLCSEEVAIKKEQDPGWASAFDPVTVNEDGAWRVRCPCGLQTGPYMTEQSAIENWNRRGGKYLTNAGLQKFIYKKKGNK